MSEHAELQEEELKNHGDALQGALKSQPVETEAAKTEQKNDSNEKE